MANISLGEYNDKQFYYILSVINTGFCEWDTAYIILPISASRADKDSALQPDL